MADKEVEGKEAGKEVDPVLENTTEWVDELSPSGNTFGCAAVPARCPEALETSFSWYKRAPRP
jgi:hypothetical protein